MAEHVTTDHILFVQWDAMAYNKDMWTNDFLQYDYIGAPWPWAHNGVNIGNGGFSLRSRRLLDALQDPHIQSQGRHEDLVIGEYFRPYLESKGMRYPTVDVAAQFSYELGDYQNSFGFHGPWNVIKLADLDTVDYYIDQMSYAGWNIHKWHHFLLALTERNCYNYIGYAVEQLDRHSPELFESVIQWLSQEHSFWNQFR